jgi:hypothetical protein
MVFTVWVDSEAIVSAFGTAAEMSSTRKDAFLNGVELFLQMK